MSGETTRGGGARLVARIYLLWLATLLCVAALLGLVLRYASTVPPPDLGRFLVHTLAEQRAAPATQARTLAAVDQHLHVRVALYDDRGQPLVSSRAPPLVPAPTESELAALAELPDGERFRRGRVYHFAGGFGLVQFPHAYVGFVIIAALLALALASVVLARALTRPLRRLSAAARAFGAGELETRVGLDARHAFGDVAAAFDEMAARVSSLLKEQRELIANVSHELRTPLARARVALDLAIDAEQPIELADARALAEDIEALERLVGDLLTSASLDLSVQSGARGAAVHRSELALTRFVQDIVDRFQATYPAHPARLASALTDDRIALDPTLARRALENILDNARKYSEVDAPIEITLVGDAERVTITVEDRGIGIPPEDLEAVWGPLFRSERSRSRATGGVGLGLTLVKKIVEAHGGAVAIANASPRGVRVTLTLPRRVELVAR